MKMRNRAGRELKLSLITGALTLFAPAPQVLAASSQTGAAASSTTTVGYWRFEEGTAGAAAEGTGSILDSSGNGLNGTPFNGPIYTAIAAVPGSSLALSFNGGGQRVAVPDSPQLAITQSLTLEAYIKFSGVPGNQGYSQIVFRGDDRGSLDPYELLVSSQGNLCFEVTDANDDLSAVCSPTALRPNQWMHVAGTLDDASGAQSVYINGVQVATTNTTIRPFGPLDPGQNPGLGIGNVQSGNYGEYFKGLIDEVRISNAALTPAQFLPPVISSDGYISGAKALVTCVNTTTGQQVKIPLPQGGVWSCIAAGLQVNSGQKFTVEITGTVK